jgi:ribosomal protein L31
MNSLLTLLHTAHEITQRSSSLHAKYSACETQRQMLPCIHSSTAHVKLSDRCFPLYTVVQRMWNQATDASLIHSSTAHVKPSDRCFPVYTAVQRMWKQATDASLYTQQYNNWSFENVGTIHILRIFDKNQNLIQEGIKIRLNSGNAFCPSVLKRLSSLLLSK